MKKFSAVGVGGTFDQLHKGHEILLMKAFELGDQVLIGLCSDEFVRELNKPHLPAPYKERLRALRVFLSDHNYAERAEIFP